MEYAGVEPKVLRRSSESEKKKARKIKSNREKGKEREIDGQVVQYGERIQYYHVSGDGEDWPTVENMCYLY